MATSIIPSSLIETSLISSNDFNKIFDIHDQGQLEPDTLKAIGAIFQAHDVTDKFGLQLLHRHYQIPEDSIAVTTQIGGSIAVTKITPVGNVDTTAIRGQLYFLNDNGNFQAYEYEYGPAISFPSAFLVDLAAFIKQYGLQSKVALISDAPPSNPSYEVFLGSNATATVAGDVWKGGQNDMETIGWKFTKKATPDSSEIEGPVNFIGFHFYWKCTINQEQLPFNFETSDVKTYLNNQGCI